MPAILPVLMTATQLILVSDVPTLNVRPSCEAAASAAIGENRNEDACMNDEQRAHDKLRDQWDQFSSAAKSRCVSLSHRGGSPSYVELLTCLEIAKAAKEIPGDGLTTGMGSE